MIAEVLYGMLKEMKPYHRSKEELLEQYINTRLAQSVQTYYSELEKSIEYLNAQEAVKVVKHIK